MTDFLVVALGGNAILPSGQRGTLEEQRENVRQMSEQLGQLVRGGHRIVVTHGNGPQVGEIMLRSELARHTVPPVSLDIGGAMTQGQLGYMLQQEIRNCLTGDGVSRDVCSIVTQVVVHRDDPAFQHPTKPIGRFYTVEEAARLRKERGWDMVEDSGRGYRRVVPSPLPQTIVEWRAVKLLVDAGILVIAAGGGGIPVIEDGDGRLRGVEAVIDKDRAAQRLASLLGAGTLVLLTEVEAVAVNFGKPDQRVLRTVTLPEMKAYYAQGQFPAGSMGPKIGAAIRFLEEGGEQVVITSPPYLVRAVMDRSAGTHIARRRTSGTTSVASLSGGDA